MQINRPSTNVTTAGQTDDGLPKPGQQRSQHQEPGPDPGHGLGAGLHRPNAVGAHHQIAGAGALDQDAERPEEADHGPGVGDVGDAVEGGGAGAAERASEHSEGRVLGAADVDVAGERAATGDDELVVGAVAGEGGGGGGRRPMRSRRR